MIKENIALTDYHSLLINSSLFRKNLNRAVRFIQKLQKKQKIDRLAVTGLSGTVFGGALSYLTKIPLLLVRKKHDRSHSTCKVEGFFKKKLNYLIVDDLIESGATIDHLIEQINLTYKREVQEDNKQLTCMGILLYNSLYGSHKSQKTYNQIPVYHLKTVCE